MNFIFKIDFIKWILILSTFFISMEARVNTLPENIFKYTHCKIKNAHYIVPLSRHDITKTKDNRCEGYYHTKSDAMVLIYMEAYAWALKNNLWKDGVNRYLHKRWPQSYSADLKFGIRIDWRRK